MCGISVILQPAQNGYSELQHSKLLARRGPDHQAAFHQRFRTSEGQSQDRGIVAKLYASVLSLRSRQSDSDPVVQPLCKDRGNSQRILLWNGEAWKINGQTVAGNDSEAVYNLLQSKNDPNLSRQESILMHVQAMARIEGPFSFAFFDFERCFIIFGRDFLGRRSLLFSRGPAKSQGGPLSISLSSVCHDSSKPDEVWEEVDCEGLYFLDFCDTTAHGLPAIGRVDWATDRSSDLVLYDASAQARRLAGFEVETMTVSFPQMNQSRNLTHTSPGYPTIDSTVITTAYKLLLVSMQTRILNIRKVSRDSTDIPKIAVLFSGGLDCTILARLAHDILLTDEPIDLLNVAFENPRVVEASKNPANAHSSTGLADGQNAYAKCPDRQTARKSLAELRSACPGRSFRLHELDIPFKTYMAHEPLIKTLIYPKTTEMDLSIGAALYFASRGIDSSQDPEPETSACKARVLLSGFGADELYGGYSRYRLAYQRGGYEELVTELEKDFNRIGQRNLGRDDRVLSHWGRETRYPYLDEDFVRWTLERPVWEKCGYGAPTVDTFAASKRTLRVLAAKLGLPGVAKEPKRAIQFGARTAKMIKGRSKGTDIIAGPE